MKGFKGVVAAASAFSLLLAPLVARAEPASTSVHVVEPGETLSQIADNVGVDAAALVRLNSLDDVNFLVVGQSLKIPTKTGAAAGPGAPASPPAAAPASPRTMTIAAGDTLWSIAQQFSTSTAAMVDANTLDDPDHLIAGAQLVLPAGASAGRAAAPASAATAAPKPNAGSSSVAPAKRTLLVPYTVQAGETLSQIAHQFDVRPDAIAQASGLDDPNRLSIGTVVKVPLPGHEHQVQAGETLRDIAAQEKVDLGSLIDFNALDDPELIRVGQVLMVPTPPNQVAATASASSTAPKPTAAICARVRSSSARRRCSSARHVASASCASRRGDNWWSGREAGGAAGGGGSAARRAR